jgi:hypothetical protein
VEQFQERLSRLAELSPAELDEFEAEVTAAFDAADADANLEDMQALADVLDEIRQAKSATQAAPDAETAPVDLEPAVAASGAEETAAPESEPEQQQPESEPETGEPASEPAIEPEQPEPDPEPNPQPEPESEPEPESQPEQPSDEPEQPGDTPDTTTPAEGDNAEAPHDESEDAVATEITADDVPEENAPVVASGVRPYTIRAGGDIPGITAGAELSDMDAVVEALSKKIGTMRGVRGDGEHIIVASMRTEEEAPEDRTLRAGDLNGNSRKIRELLGDRDQLTPEGLVAAGWCAPRQPIYDVPTVGTTGRPIRDSLPSFNADRGGITWAEPPTLPTGDFGVGIWRYESDAWGSYTNPTGSGSAGDTKPCFTIECGEEASADVEALTLCLCFNNMMTRAFPEWVRANTDLTMVAQARFAEQVLLSKMFGVAATGSCGSVETSVGVARDFLFSVQVAAASKRWEQRIDPNSPLQLLAPSWVADAVAIDLGLQAPGDDTYGTSRAVINGHLRDIGVDPVWFIDDAPAQAAFSGCAFPAVAHWLLYPTGTFLRLDAGELNLGVVRTKEDLQKNAYCEFSETFETVAHMGPANQAWITRGVTEVNLYGATGAPINLT